MFRDVQVRALIQRNNTAKDKYYPSVISASSSHSYPFSVPTATIEIATNTDSSTSGFTSPVKVDDIIRLQVAIKTRPAQATVWQDIFSGRIRTIKGSYGTKNTSEIYAVGHLEEAEWTIIEETYTPDANSDATEIIEYFVEKYHRMLAYTDDYVDGGLTIPSYSSNAYQTYLSDLFSELEKISGSDWFVDCLPIYDSDNNLETVYVTWYPFSEEVTDQYQIIEGTDRFISCDFESSIDELVTYYRIMGDTPAAKTPEVSVNAAYSNAWADTWTDTATVSLANGSFSSSSMSVWIDPGAAAHYQTVGGGTIGINGSSSVAVSGTVSGTNAGHATQTIGEKDTIKQPQYAGYQQSTAALQAQYGKRTKCETYTWIKTATQCTAIASGMLSDMGKAQKSGAVTILGTPASHIGDLVHVKLPSVEVDGAAIDDTFNVYRVTHNISATEYTTTLDLGRVVKDAYDYIGMVSKNAKSSSKNFCKG